MKRAEVGGSGSIPPQKYFAFMPSKIAADAILGQDIIAFHSFTSIKHSEQLSKRRDSAAKNTAATTVSTSKNDASVCLKMRKCSCYEGGEGKSGGYGPKGHAAIESVSARIAKNFGPIFWIHVHEVSGATPPSSSKVERPRPPLPPRFRRP